MSSEKSKESHIYSNSYKISFQQFKVYCLTIQQSLNCLEGYYAQYKEIKHPFAKMHDAEYLEVVYTDQQYRIKLNLTYSIAYQVPLFYFMVYNQNSQPLSSQAVYERFMQKKQQSEELDPKNEERGIYLSQNPISKEYFYTLHHCEIKMSINHLVPFYLSLLGLHPPLVV